MIDPVDRQAAIDEVNEYFKMIKLDTEILVNNLITLPSAQPDNRLEKIADIVEGTIDHLNRDDAMDMLYQIKEVLK